MRADGDPFLAELYRRSGGSAMCAEVCVRNECGGPQVELHADAGADADAAADSAAGTQGLGAGAGSHDSAYCPPR